MTHLALTSGESTRFHTLAGSRDDLSAAMTGWVEAGLVVRVVRGRKMPTWPRALDEFAAVWQFPLYFGENPDALMECLTDLEWSKSVSGFALVVTEPGDVLCDERPEALCDLVDILDHVVSDWGTPVELGEWWDRPGVPFNVVLHVGSESGAARWESCGATMSALPA